MTNVLGKDKVVKIDIAGTMTEVAHQGEASFNPGKEAGIATTKNSKLPYTTENGATVTFPVKLERPAHATYTALVAADASGAPIEVDYTDKNAGGSSRSGPALITLGEETTPVQGELAEQQVTVSFVDDPAVGVAT